MARTVHEPGRVRFERVEHDGRRHSPWVLSAAVERRRRGQPSVDAPALRRRLGGPLVERLLADEIAGPAPACWPWSGPTAAGITAGSARPPGGDGAAA